ncbi:MAG: cell division protein FtsQ/DivIB [Dongiaceae bacterium]
MRFLNAAPPETSPRQRRLRRAWWRRHRARLGIAALVVTALAASVLGLYAQYQSGHIERGIAGIEYRLIDLSRRHGLVLDEIIVVGRQRTDAETLLSTLAVKRGAPMFALQLEQMQNQVQQLPWIKSARLERRLPHTLYIQLVEREPMARWQQKGKLRLVDGKGKIINGQELSQFSHLPLIVGGDAPKNAPGLFELLQIDPVLAGRVRAATWVGGRRWDLHLDNNVLVRLPATNLAEAWAQFAQLVRQEGLLEKDIIAVDLRIPERLYLELPREVVPVPNPRGRKETST